MDSVENAQINNIKDCLHRNTITVLMGRDNAFSGIYSQKVLNDFNGRALLSEKDPNNNRARFLEIDMLSDIHKWYSHSNIFTTLASPKVGFASDENNDRQHEY